MPGKNNGGLKGLIRTIGEVSRTANSVHRATSNVKRAVGAKKNSAKNQKETAAAPAKSTTPDPNAWTCVCGTLNTTKFCGSCGKAAPAETACPNCGWKRTPENSGMKFCGECGTKFEE